jgi:class 3 adenylate cyclase
MGSCLAIGENDRLDYFGTTVNVAARLCALSTGADIVVSRAVMEDPGVAALLAGPEAKLAAAPDRAPLRGMGEGSFEFWRVTAAD